MREHRFNRATFRVTLVEGVSSQPTQARRWAEFGNLTMKTHNHQKLFSPVQIGPITLAHRVVMAPLTRSRSLQPGDIPSDLMREYYAQRASDGGFIISEATSISITGRGWLGAPGLYSDEQVDLCVFFRE